MNAGESFIDAIGDVPVKFGLRAQGKFATVAALVSDDVLTWDEIGKEIGWDGEAARRFYELEASDESDRLIGVTIMALQPFETSTLRAIAERDERINPPDGSWLAQMIRSYVGCWR